MSKHPYAVPKSAYRLPTGAIIRVIVLRPDISETVVECRYMGNRKETRVAFTTGWFEKNAVGVLA